MMKKTPPKSGKVHHKRNHKISKKRLESRKARLQHHDQVDTLRRCREYICWYNREFSTPGVVTPEDIDPVIVGISQLLKYNGGFSTITYLKQVQLCTLRYMGGNPLHAVTGRLKLSLTRKGIPRFLGNLGRKFEDDPQNPDILRVILGLTNIHRTLGFHPPEIDLSPVTDGWEKDPGNRWEFEQYYYPAYMALSGMKVPLGQNPPIFRDYHLSQKKGMNGSALASSLSETLSITPRVLEAIRVVSGSQELVRRIQVTQELAMKISGEFEDYLGEAHAPWTRFKDGLRRLSSVLEPGGKHRIIAIFDYFSQCALRPLHQWAMGILKRIPEDCTFDHSKVPPVPEPGHHYHSLDLKSATDRFPMCFQRMVVELLFGKEYAHHWAYLMVGIPFLKPSVRLFDTPEGFEFWDSIKDPICYFKKGQPLGGYSSWAVFALCHHVVVRIAAQRCGKVADGKYMLLGDDIVICDDDIAREYRSLLASWEVEIQEVKTHVSEWYCEFAKRHYVRSREVTGPQTLWVCKENAQWYEIPEHYQDLCQRRGRTHRAKWAPHLLAMLDMSSPNPGGSWEIKKRLVKEMEHLTLIAPRPRMEGDDDVERYCKLYDRVLGRHYSLPSYVVPETKHRFIQEMLAHVVADMVRSKVRLINQEIQGIKTVFRQLLQAPGVSQLDVNDLTGRCFPLTVIVGKELTRCKILLQKLNDRDFTPQEVLEYLDNEIPCSPLALWHERPVKKIVRNRAEAVYRIRRNWQVVREGRELAYRPLYPEEGIISYWRNHLPYASQGRMAVRSYRIAGQEAVRTGWHARPTYRHILE